MPAVFDRVPPESPLALDEIFGLVFPIIRLREPEEAISIANGAGLAASVFTSRTDLAHRFAARIETGMIHINHGTASQAHVPLRGERTPDRAHFRSDRQPGISSPV